ncbi:MAG: tetratricopeptide repeat protein [Gemmatimonadales bacterium]|jgi:tetratricopeptide (TPR) repeat protein
MNVRFLPIITVTVALPISIGSACRGERADSQAVVEGQPWEAEGYTGSQSCRECHERFYQLWAPSHHGLAMQPFTAEFAQAELAATEEEFIIDGYGYGLDVDAEGGWLLERGSDDTRRYRVRYALGGKNVYYFLAQTERGRLQVIPLGFDVREGSWFDATGSMVRHFGDREDEPLHWTDRLLTFNTSCHGCHVSQLSTNYDPETDSYRTTWAEPGINCETCHGPADEHIRVFREAPEGSAPKDTAIIRMKTFTVEQTNSACGVCHAKGYSLVAAYEPGDRFFDSYALVALEHPDYYPDGRDLGENYTYTSWLASRCVKTGQLDCLHCHTSSGRFRFADDPNAACLPCHAERVAKASDHSHHPEGSQSSQCIACHMPKTSFARMERSDHSMLAPTPAATREFGSPNACNLCHADRDAAWADRWVREWRERDYQAPVLRRARLIDAARREDWSQLPQMLDYLTSGTESEVYAASLIRLLRSCEDGSKWPAIIGSLDSPSPLVRAAAADALIGNLTPETVPLLLKAVRDDYRLVRLRAASSLASVPREMIPVESQPDVDAADAELITSLEARPDDWASHYDLGNFYLNRREFDRAIAAYERAFELEPRATVSMVNAAVAYELSDQPDKAMESLLRVLEVEPGNPAANLQLGLLLGEAGRDTQAEAAFHAVLAVDTASHEAAYNLCVLLAADRLDEAIRWCRKAAELRPDEPRYSYTVAYYLRARGDTAEATARLRQLIADHRAFADAHILLADIYAEGGEPDMAESILAETLAGGFLSADDRARVEEQLEAVQSTRRPRN